MKQFLQIQVLFIFCLLIKFKTHMSHELSVSQSDDQVETSTFEIPSVEPNPTYKKITSKAISNHSQIEVPILKEKSSVEYLIEEPNNWNSSHNQEVIIKPLNEFPGNLKEELFVNNKENKQQLPENLTCGLGNQINVTIQEEPTDQTINPVQTLKNALIRESQKHEVIPPANEKKEELIINLLSSPNKTVTTSIWHESIASPDQKYAMQTVLDNQISQPILKDNLLKESTRTFFKMRVGPLHRILQILSRESVTQQPTTESQLLEAEKKKEDFVPDQFTAAIEEQVEAINSTNDNDLLTTSENLKSEQPLEFENISNQIAVSKAEQSSNSGDNENSTMLWFSNNEELEVTTKPFLTFEDYAVKQMNFILDHILLESHAFVAKVLQATGTSSTTFHRDQLKRYAENINLLLNPLHENDYSDDVSDYKPVTHPDLYEEVVKKLNFIKSKATKQLQTHLPVIWLKEYKDTKETLKVWLDKASHEMQLEFNQYLNEQEDHIKYLYFNEAFDDIIRSTEIHQKLALLADLIKIVKNKKQITFMDLYMQ